MNFIEGGITAPQGFKAAGVAAGIRKKEKKDVAIVYSQVPAQAAAVYTINKFKAAPLKVTAEHLADGIAQAMVINSGIANACMGQQGMESAKEMAEITAQVLNIKVDDVVVASTGLIGAPLPMDRLEQGIKEAASKLSTKGGSCAAEAIMTTDLVKKEVAVQLELGEKQITIGAMAKGSGMIHPNMATMLGFITTDADVSAECLQKSLKTAVETSFNMISVDGDTSTNDMVVIMANGIAGNPQITLDNEYYVQFQAALTEICVILAKMIAQDGEGATKLIEVEVSGALSLEDARKAARTICSSSLVKSAIFGEDANWGRIITALGYSGAEVEPEKVDVYIGDLMMAENGTGLSFDEDKAGQILAQKEVIIKVDLKLGEFEAKAWGCDLSYDYVRINADYRT
ncbi:MAG: glutamate N-acetyltransferase / amino-acid N-acetyltransferase [Clostridia bacterium]|jgi:glutamate N-acetyltransferase/amino-acid N-acetyltransferase|nr:glutamate N-acetyltransferase / amino-acid N-acetyltransferase [Clostridia bacterium]MDN5323206.1 glutamate N-acetyltransferase / amino-acid N-acetyltransferase [Clostridia bacterium]